MPGKLGLALTLLSSLSLVWQSNAIASSNSCERWQISYNYAVEHFKAVNYESLRKENLDNTQVVFLGEHHLHHLLPMYEWLFGAFKKLDPSFDCVFLEEDRDQKLSDADSRIQDRYKAAQRKGLKPFFVDKFAPKPDWILSWYQFGLLKESDPIKYREYADRFSDWITSEAYARNFRIADNIRSLLSQGQCKRAIAIYGSFHLDDGDNKNETKTIPQLLSEAKISAKAYLMREPLTQLGGTDLGNPQTSAQNLNSSLVKALTCGKPGQDLYRKTLLGTGFKNSVYSGIFLVPQDAIPATN